jgi:cysteinyl-tRNA synthetase
MAKLTLVSTVPFALTGTPPLEGNFKYITTIKRIMLRLYNTKTKTKETFQPLQKNKVGLYVCGVTVYNYCHVGNARVYVVFDVLARFLKQQGYDVNYVRNITDIDDKIIKQALDENVSFDVIAKRYTEAFHKDMARLSVLPPEQEPRATEYLPQMIAMIETLIAKKHAYVGQNGDVYFAVNTFPDYGKLSRQDLEGLRLGERIAVSDAKKDPLDFVLWKHAKENEPAWPSPFGPGRPGWHIECSAMSCDCLKGSFDIHGGGLDLTFPHHENEIAQSEAATGEPFMHTWMHVGFVQVKDEKMSKSLGNFFTVREVCERYHPEVLRYFILSSHYRNPMNYSEDNLEQAKSALESLYRTMREATQKAPTSPVAKDRITNSTLVHYREKFETALNDDLNTPQALAVLFEMAHELNKLPEAKAGEAPVLIATLKGLANVLGILQSDPTIFLQGNQDIAAQANALVEQRNAARASKNWGESDRLRSELESLGLIVEDTPQGTLWRKG